MSDVDYAKQYFSQDVFARDTTGIKIEDVKSGYAKVTLNVEHRHVNGANIVMGGVYFTMADFALAIAANYDNPLTLTLSSDISFLSSAKEGEVLTAEAKCVRDGQHACFYKIDVTDSDGNVNAIVSAAGFHMDRNLPEIPPEDRDENYNPYREQMKHKNA